ncbi:MAG TPA: ATP-binding protein [Prolixibacteraceae bacterium]|nr:ATP-binding protein [Prolixibacteraceae bacterium]
MRRNILTQLLAWKESSGRKVLLLRGARQVGKTFVVRELGKTFFNYVEVNLEIDTDVARLFNKNLDPIRICQELSTFYGKPIRENETLLFFDEIQACPRAISSLRFFYENMPGLHVIAAGSLLEFALTELPSFGVGRIRSLFMYPMSFNEFLLAHQRDQFVDLINQASPDNPINPVFHEMLTDYYRKFQLIGGMPEVVKLFVENKSLLDGLNVLDDLTLSVRDDFSKYRKRVPESRIREVFASIVEQAGAKFVYSNVVAKASLPQIKEALELLFMAGLAYPVYHTAANGFPLGAQIDSKKFKVLLYDTGIFQHILGLNIREYLVVEEMEMVNKGSLAEIYAGLELIKASSIFDKPQLFYWHRQERGSNAEVDFVIRQGSEIVPVEIKSGYSGKMQSMRLFMKEKNLQRGIRSSLENFGRDGNIEIVPLYAISTLIKE